MKTPEVDQEEFKKSNYVFIRHGQSQFNYDLLVARSVYGENSEEAKKV